MTLGLATMMGVFLLSPAADGVANNDRHWAIEGDVFLLCGDGKELRLASIVLKGNRHVNEARVGQVPGGRALKDMQIRRFALSTTENTAMATDPSITLSKLSSAGSLVTDKNESGNDDKLSVIIATRGKQMGTPVLAELTMDGVKYDLRCDWLASPGESK